MRISNKLLVQTIMAGLVMTLGATAQTVLPLPDSSQQTTLTANVTEQAHVTVPAGVTFNVTDITSATAASSASVSVTNIVTASATKQLKVSLKADAAAFTPSVESATTWSAG